MPTETRHPWRRAVLWLAFLGPFFMLSYGFANALAARLTDVPSIVFGWERWIPFIPWTIVPYWSIDGFYVASLFMCTTRRELDVHARRLLTVQIVAVFCFVLFPLTFSFDRPPTEGLFGAMFNALTGFDKPFNQAPSLHIALLVVLWLRFAAHSRGLSRMLLHAWFILIGVSVLTTFQHHFIDVPTGLLAGWLCVWLWPMRGISRLRGITLTREPARRRMALWYAVGALACAAVAVWLSGAALWLWWPAASLALVAVNYALIGPAGFCKRDDGRLCLAARWLYAPYVLAAWLNSRWWTRRRPRPVALADNVWLGRAPSRHDLCRFDSIVDVCAELPLPVTQTSTYAWPMLDLVPPEPRTLRAAAQSIERARGRHGSVLVCCALGYSRSALVAAAWLMYSGRVDSAEEAITCVRTAKPEVVLGEPYLATLRQAYCVPPHDSDH